MNRAAVRNVEGLTADLLPPARRAADPRGADGGPVRVLFLNANDLGFATTSRHLAAATAARPDLDALHVNLATPRWLRWASAPGPLQSYRAARSWGWLMGRWLAGPLPLDRFDVVHVMTQQRALALAAARERGRGTPFVVNIDATSIGWCETFGPPARRSNLDSRAERRVFAAAAAVGCYSRWTKASVVKDYGIDPAKVFLYIPCVPTPHAAEAMRVRAQRPAGPLRLIFVGNDWQRKGGPRVLAWHQQRWADRAELHVCSGAAPRDSAARNVVWHGPTPNERLMREILPAMDIFVMPTRIDATPIAVQEAQSCGLPVVTTRIAGLGELVEDGVTGFLCDRDDDAAYIAAVERLLDDEPLRRRMSAAASERVATRLSADRWTAHLLDQLVAVARGRPVATEPVEPVVAGR